MSALPQAFDGPWKEALEALLPECLAFCFPAAHAGIDWDAGFSFLDKELQQVAPSGERGPQTVDKLVAVQRTDGQPAVVYLHLEVQSQDDAGFEERVYRYHARLFDRFRAPIVTLAVLGDERATWRPASYGYDLWGCRARLEFPTAKLLDFPQEQLATSTNPCALVIWAHRVAQATRRSVPDRVVEKMALLRRLVRLGYDSKRANELYRIIDWLVQVPPEEEAAMVQQLTQEEGDAPFITSAERYFMTRGLERGIEQGIERGLREGIGTVLELRFPEEGGVLLPELAEIHDVGMLRAVLARLKTAQTLDEVRAVYRSEG